MRFERRRWRELTRRAAVRGALVVALTAAGVGAAWALAGPILKSTHHSRVGAMIAKPEGPTLYHPAGEGRGRGKGRRRPGPGVTGAKGGTEPPPNGTTQLTYNKFPLYRYFLDKKAGQT